MSRRFGVRPTWNRVCRLYRLIRINAPRVIIENEIKNIFGQTDTDKQIRKWKKLGYTDEQIQPMLVAQSLHELQEDTEWWDEDEELFTE